MARSLGKIGEAFVELNVKADQLQAQFTAAQRTTRRSADRMARSVDRVDSRLARAGQTAATFGRALATLGTVAVVGSLARIARGAIEVGDQIAKTADRVGVGVEALQELRFTAERSGVGTRTLDIALQRFSRRVGEAANGSGELSKTLEQYGIAVTDANGATRSNVDILGDLADAVAGAESEQEQLRIAFKAFDSEGAALVNVLRLGSAGMDDLRDRARDLGNVMSDETARAAERAQDAIIDFNAATAGLGQTLAENTLGPLTTFIELITTLTQIGIDKFTRDLDNFSLSGLSFEANKVREEVEGLQASIERFASGSRGPGQEGRIAALNVELEEAEARLKRIEDLIEQRTLVTEGAPLNNVGGGPLDVDIAPEGPILPSPRRPQLNTIEETQLAIDRLIDSLALERDVAGLADTAQVALAETLRRLGVDFEIAGGQVRVLADEYRNLDELARQVASSDSLANPPVPEPRPDLAAEFIGPQLPTENEAAAERQRQKFAEIEAATDRARVASERFGQTVADSFADAIIGAESFEDSLSRVLETLARLILEQAILQPLAGGIASSTQGFFGGIPSAGGTTQPIPAAAGAIVPGNRISGGSPGVITGRNFTPFANGGILSGESSSEMVVPMSPSRIGPFLNSLAARGSGGGGSDIQIIDKRGTEAPPVEVRETNKGGRRVIEATVRDQVNTLFDRGAGDNVMNSRFGVTPRPGRLRG